MEEKCVLVARSEIMAFPVHVLPNALFNLPKSLFCTSADTPKLALIFIAQKQRYLQKNNSISMYFRKIISKYKCSCRD